MEKLYLDRTEIPDNMAIIVRKAEIIETGTTIYSMSVREDNELYRKFAEEYDIRFIFDDRIPVVEFYAVPRLDIFATDSRGGYFVTVGSCFDRDLPVYYMDAAGDFFLVAESGSAFVENAPNWRAVLKPWAGVEIFPTKDAAKEKYTLFGKSNLEAMHQDIMKNP